MRRLVLFVVALLLLGAGWIAYRLEDHPSLEPYADLVAPPADPAKPGLRVAFLGVSTLLVSDGTTAILTDGFFTRPGKLATLVGRLGPDPLIIGPALARAGIERLAAVAVVHSHYDHAMDSPEVARRTGAVLLGSPSTANIARGNGFPEERIRIVRSGVPERFGDFEVTLIEAQHLPHGMAMGEIDEPLVPPARAGEYLEGGSYSVLVAHPLGRLLIQGSAGWRDHALDGQRVDVVFLGVGGLSAMDDAYRDGYWRHVVEASGARCVVPIHWDDFTLPLDQPLQPMPRLLDDFDATMAFLRQRTAAAGLGLALPPLWTPIDLACGAP